MTNAEQFKHQEQALADRLGIPASRIEFGIGWVKINLDADALFAALRRVEGEREALAAIFDDESASYERRWRDEPEGTTKDYLGVEADRAADVAARIRRGPQPSGRRDAGNVP